MAKDDDIEEQPNILLEAVRDYLVANNGQVKQDDLVNRFRTELSEHHTRAEFKDILQFITGVKIQGE